MPTAGGATQSQRSQELRKYFAPSQDINAFNGGFNTNIQDDEALTSFAEATAWRLGVKRAMVSLIDGETQYFLAGADLDRKSMDGHVDWFGSSSIPVRESPCQYTIAADESTSEYPCLVIEDLSEDERFRQLPIVSGSIAAYRFYAGTSISTSRGVKIGSFFLLDNNRRPGGLNLDQRKVICKSATSVMNHLEMHREAAERRRVSLMSYGIARFLESKSHKDDEDMNDQEIKAGASSNLEHKPSGKVSPADLGTPVLKSTAETETAVKCTLESAASILRESLEIESGGVMFVDTAISFSEVGYTDAYSDPATSVGQRMGPADGTTPVLRDDKEFSLGAYSTSSRDSDSGQMRSPVNGSPAATVIAMSKSKEHQPAQPTNEVLDSKTLQTLLNRYPEGNVWYFDDTGYFSSLEQIEDYEMKDKSHEANRHRVDVNKRLSEEKAEAMLLKVKFEKARQIVFLPMWDAATKRWYAGCLVWSHSAVPVFTVDSEIAYLAAFTNSVTMEVSRLDAIRADQAKADFISSISHEFRSPLHGILASAEFLRELTFDETQSELISTVQNCGRTLLETINHVLDFSKINSFDKPRSGNLHGGSLQNELYSVTNLAVLCEEVVEGMIVAKDFDVISSSVDSTTRPRHVSQPANAVKQPVEVVLDFEKHDWQFLTQPGALRRIIMNIFGNAQKYTDKGYIQISIRVEDPVRARAKGAQGMSSGKSAVSLIIKDSGRGISNDYLRHRLYTPFAQDDTFASGIGLGLSIVWSIVQQMGGVIAVRSLQGKGTEVDICLPVEEPDRSHGTHIPENGVGKPLVPDATIQALREVKTKTTIALQRPPNLPRDPLNGQNMILDRVEGYISDWYGLTVVTFTDWSNIPTADAVVALEAYESSIPSALPRSGNRFMPLLLLNGNLMSKGRRQYPAKIAVGHVSRPVGPFSLARHLLSILQTRTVELISDPQQSVPLVGNASENRLLGERLKDLSLISDPQQPATQEPEIELVKKPSLMNVRSTDAILSPNGANKHSKAKSGLHILAVDDNEINLQLLRRFLSKRKDDLIDLARDGFEAVAAVKTAIDPYDVIFMDISMPGMDGFQATRKIRQYENERAAHEKDDKSGSNQGMRKGSHSYIVALTGLGASRDREEATQCGFDDYLTKPIPFQKVGKLLEELSRKETP